MKKAIIIGASGLVGSLLTKKLLNDSYYETVTVLVRSSLNIHHPKLIELKVNFDELFKEKIEADDVYCCLGSTIKKAGSKERFRLIDYTYSLNVAKIAKKYNCNQFIIVTAMGANSNSLAFYSKVKGDLENALKALNFNSLLIIRPSLLLGDRKNETRSLEKVASLFMQYFSLLLPKKVRAIKADKVATAMMDLAKRNYFGFHIFESDVLQSY